MIASRLACLALVALTSLACSGGSGPAPAAPPAAPPAPAAPPPTGQLSITAADLRAHVELLSSDQYRGRETLTEGAEMAAEYLSRQLEAYGLTPLPGRSSFKAPYTLEEYGFNPEKNAISIAAGDREIAGALGTDFAPFSFSKAGVARDLPVVFAGYGITAPEHGWDDYKGLDVKGKAVLVLRHWPREKNEKDNPFAGGIHGAFTAKAANAAAHGAVAMLLVTDPVHHAENADELQPPTFVRLPRTAEEKAQLAKGASESESGGAAVGKRPGRRAGARAGASRDSDGILAVHVSQKLAATITGDLSAIQTRLDAGELAAREIALAARATVAVAAAEPREVQPDNVIGFLEGSDPELRKQWIVIGGHYDHLGQHGAEGKDNIYNGADDNASGTAGVLELAQAFASLPERPARSLVFIGFSGEEKGLLGSFAMLAEKQLPEERIVFMLNLDMIGRNPDKPVEVLGEAYASGLADVIGKANAGIQLDIELAGTNYSASSDHHPFYVRDIPMMFFFTGTHEDYHGLDDHADKLAFDRMEKIVRLGYGVIEPIARGQVSPAFIHNLIWLGARIEARGPDAVVTEIEPDSRGARAGLVAGDVITAIGGEALARPAEVGKRFRDMKPGQATRVEVRRGSATASLEVTRAKQGFLGVFPGRLPETQRKKLGLADDEGVLIGGVVDGGPGAKAGLEKGDVLISLGGNRVDQRSLGRQLSRIGAGEKVAAVVVRNGERKKLTLVLGERPQRP
jgi:hypothetical protein